MKISICSQVKNRRHQLEKTIGYNLKVIKGKADLEWVIVDMGSDDGLEELIEENAQEGVHYYKILEEKPYSIPISKNFSARLSSGDYVFNLDIDNFVCDIDEQIRALNYEGVYCDICFKGVFGRIGCSKDIFKKVGGYDESFLPAAYHEYDFMDRCKRAGYNFHHVKPGFMPIGNDKKETTKHMPEGMSWGMMNQCNKQKAAENAAAGVINPNKTYTKARFLHNFREEVSLGNEF
jgi:glycosyltransferase involved in cell wall biosynthesis